MQGFLQGFEGGFREDCLTCYQRGGLLYASEPVSLPILMQWKHYMQRQLHILSFELCVEQSLLANKYSSLDEDMDTKIA
jgi:hypothetical protein